MRICSTFALALLICSAVAHAELVVDNLDPGFSTSGVDWSESSAVDEYNGSSLYTNDLGDTARWTPDIPVEGDYMVYAWWASTYPTGGIMDRDAEADYTIYGMDAPATVEVDQNQNYGKWYYLGTFKFAAGQTGYVELVRDTASGTATSADAVKFVCVPEPLSLAIVVVGGMGLLARKRS